MLKDINPTGDSTSPYYDYGYGFTEYNGKLYFVAYDGTNGEELWVTDGTEVGTHKIAPDISPNSDPFASFSGFIVFDKVYFSIQIKIIVEMNFTNLIIQTLIQLKKKLKT